MLTIGRPADAAETFVLVQRGTEPPALDGDLAGATVIEIPIETMFSESTSHYGFIDVLDIEETVTGVGDASLIVTPALAERAAAGEIESFAPNFVVDPEIVVAADPDVYVTGGFADPAHEVSVAAGIPVVPNVEWLETTPEGWAEWVGLFAALTEHRGAGERPVRGVDSPTTTPPPHWPRRSTERPTVITGGLFEGTWYANGGASVVAEFIADAGGDYVYAETLDRVDRARHRDRARRGADADVWLLPRGSPPRKRPCRSTSGSPSSPPGRRAACGPTRSPSTRAVNFIESGPVMIDEYLLDYVAVLHPDLVPDHEFVFLSEVPPS